MLLQRSWSGMTPVHLGTSLRCLTNLRVVFEICGTQRHHHLHLGPKSMLVGLYIDFMAIGVWYTSTSLADSSPRCHCKVAHQACHIYHMAGFIRKISLPATWLKDVASIDMLLFQRSSFMGNHTLTFCDNTRTIWVTR